MYGFIPNWILIYISIFKWGCAKKMIKTQNSSKKQSFESNIFEN